ncbi:probable DNA mismatch repair protein Msh6 [Microplitis mediator]|uniref:probable DNA mismatch repair protein Msh6 n=1 Tax=Microplitis mediator TaxID=375433 RepID=UPI00255708EF|nr:probable DNA mismatch repair protein Msh6 [Microplitis mediator]
MSKRSTQTNTLYNYFTSPKVPKKEEKKETKVESSPKPSTPKREIKAKPKAIVNGKENKEGSNTPKRKRQDKEKPKAAEEDLRDEEKDEEKDEETPVKTKRRRIIIPSDESGDDSDEYKPGDDEASDSDASISSGVATSEADTTLETGTDDDPTPKKERKARNPSNAKKSQPTKKAVEINDDESGKSYQLAKAQLPSGPTSGAESWPHLKIPFIQPDKIRDAKRRKPDDPEYDPKTIYVPQEFLDQQTPAMRQWWVLKSQHWDCVFFFKVGKFYELYHMDAVTGVNALGLTFMRGEWAHSGFPETSYGRFSSMLVEKGYKVARIEQTENPAMMAQRCEKSQSKITKFDKVVKREICQISTRGTRVATVQDTESFSPDSKYLLSIVEQQNATQLPSYGICFIDTSIGVFHLGQFEDDRHNSRLLTLLSHYTPVHVVYEKGNLSPITMKILNTQLPTTTMKEGLLKESQFWTATKVLEKLHEGQYFKYESAEFSWPEGLKPYLNERDTLGLSPADDKQLAVNALGGCVYVLTDYVLDQQLLAQKKFKTYVPPDMNVAADGQRIGPLVNMVIDAVAIINLNILGKSPSLLTTLDHCCTAFGKRLLKEWVCRPACHKKLIIARQDAVTELCDLQHVCQDARKLLSTLPDLERSLSKIHAHGNAAKMKNHPDGRAFMFEMNTYNQRKITDFVNCLKGFDQILKIMQLFKSFESNLIVQTTQTEPRGEFPDLSETLKHFERGFDSEAALKQGCIIPKKGMDAEYDKVIAELAQVKKDADDYLRSQSRYFGVEVKYTGTKKNAFQIEVPESRTNKITDRYELQSQRKGFKRYWTAETKEILRRLTEAEEQREKVLKDSDRRTFAKFSEHYDMWATAVYKVAVLDVLISLAQYARSGDMCVPEINDTNEVMIDIKDGKHPFITSDNFVPNDTSLASNGYGPLVILTGPNMGGKSTIMRQVGLLSIMAHIGCHIPAQSCKFSLIDRVFTRLGANDDMVTGRSTFLVELSEAATFVQHATKHSLVLVDELGRGTSTHDGAAIAAAVLQALTKLECRSIFSTHYHSLVDDFKNNSSVSPAHMACLVESEESDATQETVTFLYKLAEGACPKSYGFNAARIAGIKANITKRANDLAKKLEDAGSRRSLFMSLCNVENNNVKGILTQLNAIAIK